jgi:hypothetical protein
MGPTHCPETSVNNYHTTPRNIPEEPRFSSTSRLNPEIKVSLSVLNGQKPSFVVMLQGILMLHTKFNKIEYCSLMVYGDILIGNWLPTFRSGLLTSFRKWR